MSPEKPINEEQAVTEPHQPLKKSRKQIAHAVRSSRGHIEQEPPMIPRDSVVELLQTIEESILEGTDESY